MVPAAGCDILRLSFDIIPAYSSSALYQWCGVIVTDRSAKSSAVAGKATASAAVSGETNTTTGAATAETKVEKPAPPAPKTFTTRPVSPSKPYAAITGAKEPTTSSSASTTTATETSEDKTEKPAAAETAMVQKTQTVTKAVKAGNKKVCLDSLAGSSTGTQ